MAAAFRTSKSRLLRRLLLAALLVLALCTALFVFNGTNDSWRVPAAGSVDGVQPLATAREVRVLAFNLAKCDFYTGGLSFADEARVRGTLDRVAAMIERERIDIACLSEVVLEAGPATLNHAAYLASACGFARYAASENYSFGLPFLRVRTGNAMLSRFELEPIETQQLAGSHPFYRPTNNRRVLWCDVVIDGERVLAASVRNDSFDLANNLDQMREILAYIGDRPALLAGDFNAGPATESMQLIDASARFTSSGLTTATFPAHAPDRRIDYIRAPKSWTLVEEHLVDTGASDHLAVIATYSVR